MKPNTQAAAICGLFCGTCPSYPDACGGCLSSNVASFCTSCPAGFRECAKKHNALRCNDCPKFTNAHGDFCEKLLNFSQQHWQNGICHHADVIDNLIVMRSHGAEKWVETQTKENTCPKCDELIIWYDKKRHRCEQA